uniref:Uncharacterized protein n=1 Tax=Arundo donax TaxID=35708 RepID=A0A0A9GR04_ARUDO
MEILKSDSFCSSLVRR